MRMHISEYPCLGVPNYLYVANWPSLQYFIEHKQNSSAINLFFSVNGQQQKAREATWLQKNKAQVPTLKERKSEVKKRHSGKARGNCDSRY